MNQDGTLSPEELPSLLRELRVKDKTGDNYTSKIERFLQKFDTNASGGIEFSEFVDLLDALEGKLTAAAAVAAAATAINEDSRVQVKSVMVMQAPQQQ